MQRAIVRASYVIESAKLIDRVGNLSAEQVAHGVNCNARHGQARREIVPPEVANSDTEKSQFKQTAKAERSNRDSAC